MFITCRVGVATVVHGTIHYHACKVACATAETLGDSQDADKAAASTQRGKAGGDHKLVRTDHRDTSLKPFLVSNPTKAADVALAGARHSSSCREACDVTDMCQLKDAVCKAMHGMQRTDEIRYLDAKMSGASTTLTFLQQLTRHPSVV